MATNLKKMNLEELKNRVLTSLYWVNRIQRAPEDPESVKSVEDSVDYPTFVTYTLTDIYTLIDILAEQDADS